MSVKTGSAWAGTFVTEDATGALATPSVGPAGVLYVDGAANAASVTITGSNPYKFAVTLPALTAGQRVDMYITATITTIATASVVASEQADTILVSDLQGADSDTLETLSDQMDAIKTETASILEDTGTTIPGTITTIDNFLDTEVAAILEDTATTIPASIDALPTAAEIVAAIGSSLIATAAMATALSVEDSDTIEIYRDTTVVINFTGLGNVEAYAAAGDIAWFTIKENLDDADTSSILQMKTTSFGDSGAASTLLYVNGAAPTATDEGSFLFSDYVTGAATATLKAVAAVDLPVYAVTPVYWDIKATTAAGVVTILATGTAYIYATSTRTIS